MEINEQINAMESCAWNPGNVEDKTVMAYVIKKDVEI
jgi:hypothetical protein